MVAVRPWSERVPRRVPVRRTFSVLSPRCPRLPVFTMGASMRRPGPLRPLRALLSSATVTTLSAGLAALGGGGAVAAQQTPSHTANPMPAHVAAPYFEAWTGESPAALAAESGNKYLTMAFLQTAATGSCTAYWNGDSTQPISQAAFGSDIAAIQAHGGNVIPSFGGY